jgi:hypothetical protein
MSRPAPFGLLVAVCITVALAVSTLAAEPAKLSFNRDIRPILSENCFQCHGFDDKTREAGLRLDQHDAAIKKTDSGVLPIVPGDAAKSDVLARVTSQDKDVMMPPPSTHKKLTAQQIDTLRRWINEGAEYQGHWAWLTPQRPELPKVSNPAWAKNAIDHFILARLDAEKLKPSPEADRATLIRRVTLDLTGLPPTPAEVDAFLADKSPDAYERVVDRLLASPRYGERMAMQWLDYARYADSHGFQSDSSRVMWPWRDWVIDAFNRNMPFDQFTVEQLAGDLLPNPTRAQLVATGFNRNNRHNGELGSIQEEWKIENTIDRVETTGTTWLALTMNCCRCHDHKFDPITQQNFYEFFAFFYGTTDTGLIQEKGKNSLPVIDYRSPAQDAEVAQLDKQIAAAQEGIAAARKELPALVAQWEAAQQAEAKAQTSSWTTLEPKSVTAKSKSKMVEQADASWLATGKAPAHETYTVTAPWSAGELSALLLEVLPDVSLPNQSLGRAPNGNFVLSRVEAELTGKDVDGQELKEPLKLKFAKAEADYSQANWSITLALEALAGKGWAVDGNDPAKRLPRRAMFVLDAPIKVPANATLTVRLIHDALNNHSIGRFRLAATSAPPAQVGLQQLGLPANVRKILDTPVAKRQPKQTTELENYYVSVTADSPVKRAEAKVTELTKQRDAYNAKLPTVMVMKEGPAKQAYILKRGEYDKVDKTRPASPNIPDMLPPLAKDAPKNRLGLARWMVDPVNPLTARVWVNRAWEKFFGVGIVRSTENFGSQAEWPSHPELLDYLATEFVRLGWDMKALQKQLVLSAAYRQAANVPAGLAERDPENRLLARGPRFRMTGEMIRDQALAASGLLVEKVGGPSVRPYMPKGVWDETSKYGDLLNYKADTGEGLYRRTMYTIWKRTAAPPTLLLMDAPSREICAVKRSRTNTPLQSLALLNEVTFVEAARKLAERSMTEAGPTPAERIKHAFKLVTAREPNARDLEILVTGYESDVKHFRQHPDAASAFLKVGDSPANDKLEQAELAALSLTANILLNMDEAVTRE